MSLIAWQLPEDIIQNVEDAGVKYLPWVIIVAQ